MLSEEVPAEVPSMERVSEIVNAMSHLSSEELVALRREIIRVSRLVGMQESDPNAVFVLRHKLRLLFAVGELGVGHENEELFGNAMALLKVGII